jgi:ABC-2 type transport system ATP-binding protein
MTRTESLRGSAREDVAIAVSGLGKVYGRGRNTFTAVRPTTLSVSRGQVLGLLGPNGAGKTTIIKMIGGLITPTWGTVRLGGFDVARQRRHAVRQLGAVLEGSRNVYWPMSAWENLLYFGQLKGLRGAEIKPRARWLLTELGLWERRGQPVGSFSRGMQQKVAVAAALITEPPIILLDEPTLGLDVEASRTVKDWITRLARDEGKTIVLTTHQLEVAQELAGRIAVIKDGDIIADLPTGQLLDRYAENRYTVSVAGPLGGLDGVLPDGSHVDTRADTSRITLPSDNPDDLHKLLVHARWHETHLLSVDQARPSLEEVFLRLINDGGVPNATEPVT